MKKILFMIAAAMIVAVSCDPSGNGVKTAQVSVTLEKDGEVFAISVLFI